MTVAQLAKHKLRLMALRAEILAEGDIELEPVRTEVSDLGGDEDEQPLAEMNQAIASKRNRDRTAVLNRVQRALSRLELDSTSFGLCTECAEPIGKRLDLLPYVELCLECQQERDGAVKTGPRRSLRDFR